MLVSSGFVLKGLCHSTLPRGLLQVVASKAPSLRPTHMRLLYNSEPRDYSLPNSHWSEDMMEQFNKFMAMSKDGLWKRVPSHRHLEDAISAWTGEAQNEERGETEKENRYILRNMDTDGLGFEHVMFCNPSERRVVCVFQPGPYLEGFVGMAHGGAIATILDDSFAACAFLAGCRGLTANLNINYKSPVLLGSVVLVDIQIVTAEERKILLSGHVRSKDGQTLHAEATALVILKKSSHL